MTPQKLEEEMLSNPVQNLQYMLRRLGTRYSFSASAGGRRSVWRGDAGGGDALSAGNWPRP